MKKKCGWAAVIILLFAPATEGAQQRFFFSPTATDPAITTYTNNHYAVTDPSIAPRGKLMVFLPGTGGTPAAYTLFVQNAASLGFHSLGLMYPNGEAINTLCTQNDPQNPDAAGQARLEVIDGIDRVSYVSVDTTNCIEHRLLKAIQYLDSLYPTRGWGQFVSGNTILWNKITICGHSQGGGHAGVMAKTRPVDRCLMFDSDDWWIYGNRPYNWMGQASLTSVANWFLISHERDQLISFATIQVATVSLDLTRYGAYLRAEDSIDPTYAGRHFLSTNLESPRGANGSYHNVAVVDIDTPLQTDGVTPLLKPAWDYMLLHVTAPLVLTLTTTDLTVTYSPGTLQQSNNLQSWTDLTAAVSPYTLARSSLGTIGFFRLETP